MNLIKCFFELILTLLAIVIFFIVMPFMWHLHVESEAGATYRAAHKPASCDYYSTSGTVNPFCYEAKRDGPAAQPHPTKPQPAQGSKQNEWL